MKLTLKPFQEKGAHFLATHPHALLGDKPGLGKTPEALRAVELVSYQMDVAPKVLVICPASVRYHWENQIVKFLGRDWLQFFTIVSYSSLHKLPAHQKWDILICDEAHFLKSITSKRTLQVLGREGIIHRCHFKWMLTGTPVLNRPRELYPILKSLWGHALGEYSTWAKFTQHFCGAFFNGHCIDDRGATNIDELAGILDGFMLRRTWEDVLPEMPKANVERVPIEISPAQWKIIEAVESEIEDREEYISSAYEKFSQLGDTSTLLRLTGLAKAGPAATFIKDKLFMNQKIVVFAKHKDVVIKLMDLLKDFNPVKYVGGMTDAQKDGAKKLFIHNPRVRVIIGNIQAMGTGVDGLQEVCNTLVFAELTWVPEEIEQCIRRLARMGLVEWAQWVNAYILHVPGTIESGVLGSHDTKIPVLRRLVGDDVGFKSLDGSEILGDLI